MPTVLLIRHGENNFVGKRLAGRLPGVHLNENGRQQAQYIAQKLEKAPICAIYSSPLERALETATPLAAGKGLEVQVCPGVIEVDVGDWQNRTLKQLRRLRLWKVVQQSPSQMRFPGGESMLEVQQRAVEAIDQIAASHQEKDLVAIFSHADVIRLATAHYLQMPLDAFQRLGADTASLTMIFFGKNSVYLPKINQSFNFEWPEPA
jgi:probable phosphoglycerate mutase